MEKNLASLLLKKAIAEQPNAVESIMLVVRELLTERQTEILLGLLYGTCAFPEIKRYYEDSETMKDVTFISYQPLDEIVSYSYRSFDKRVEIDGQLYDRWSACNTKGYTKDQFEAESKYSYIMVRSSHMSLSEWQKKHFGDIVPKDECPYFSL